MRLLQRLLDWFRPELKIKLLDEKCRPLRAYRTDSGLDLRARISEIITLQPMQSVKVPCGLAVELPEGTEGQVRPRSGLSENGKWTAFGTVDNGHRGEISATVCNISLEQFEIKPYMRIAQLVVAPVIIPKEKYVDELTATPRGNKGHGSTGLE